MNHRQFTTTLSALVLALPLASGCSRSPRDKLQGRWLGEAIENVPPEDLAKATGWVKGTSFEFSGNKVTVVVPAESPRTGSYKVAKVDGDRVTVAFQRIQGTREEATFRFHGERTLVWEAGQGREIVLVKPRN